MKAKATIGVLTIVLYAVWGCEDPELARRSELATVGADISHRVGVRLFTEDLATANTLCDVVLGDRVSSRDQWIRDKLATAMIGLTSMSPPVALTQRQRNMLNDIQEAIWSREARRHGVDLVPHCLKLRELRGGLIDAIDGAR